MIQMPKMGILVLLEIQKEEQLIKQVKKQKLSLKLLGYAFSQEIYRKGRYSSDADLLIRPSHVDRFVEILI